MKNTLLTTLLLIALASTSSQAQVGIGVATANINPSAQLEVVSTAKGFLPPRMTAAQRNGIATPAQGLMIYCTNCTFYGETQLFNGAFWTNMVGGAASAVYIDVTPRVTIGEQVWATKNLEVTTYRNGDAIPQITNATDWANATEGAWCYYNNDPANGAVYGKLYNWYAVNDSRGLAPAGYHIPTDAEFTTLTNTLGGETVAGGEMKEAGTSHWTTPNTAATNSSGFAGLPGGIRRTSGSSAIGDFGFWWSSTEYGYGTTYAWYRLLYYNGSFIGSDHYGKTAGFSVRCIKD